MTRAAAIVLILLPMAFTGRALLLGRTYAPVDLPFMSEPLNAYAEEFGVAKVHNGTLSDLYAQIIPWRSAVRTAFANGEWPLLNPFMLCGDILAGAAQSAPYDPFNLLGDLIPLPPSLTYAAAMTFFIAGIGAFAFAVAIGCSELAGLVAASGWMFSGMIAFFVGWPLARAWAFLPLVLVAVRAVVHGRRVRDGVLLLVVLTLLILAGHPESLLHVIAFGAVYGVFELSGVRPIANALRPILIATVAGLTSLLVTAIFLLPFLEASQQTLELKMRSGWRGMGFPYMPEVIARRAANMFLPFWGGQPWRDVFTPEWDPQTARTGSVIVALAVTAAIVARRRRHTWFFLPAALFCFAAGLDAPPVANLLHKLPLFDIALNGRLAFAASCCLAILAALAVDELAARRRTAAGVCVVLAVALAAATALTWRHELQVGVTAALIRTIVLAEVVPLAALAIALLTRWKYAVPLALVLVIAQRMVVDGSIYPSFPQHVFYPKIPLIRAIPKETDEPFRVAGEHFVLIPDSAAVYQLEDPRGYEAMTNARLYDTYTLWSIPQPVSFNAIGDLQPPFLSFLNIKYAIVPNDSKLVAGWREVMKDRSAKLFENTRVLPRAFVPRRVRYEKSGEPVMKAMKAATDFSDLAWIEVPEYAPHEIANGPGALKVRRDGFGFSIDAAMERDGWMVVSQTAWSGWRAYIDGRRVQTRFANHAFVGVFIPAGRHHVSLHYLPESFTRGRNISFATLAVLAVAAIAPSARRRFEKPRAVRV